jgi:hypothetical protein
MKLRQAKKILRNVDKYWCGYNSVLCDKHIPNMEYEKKSVRYFLKNQQLGKKFYSYCINNNLSIQKAVKVWDKWYKRMYNQSGMPVF